MQSVHWRPIIIMSRGWQQVTIGQSQLIIPWYKQSLGSSHQLNQRSGIWQSVVVPDPHPVQYVPDTVDNFHLMRAHSMSVQYSTISEVVAVTTVSICDVGMAECLLCTVYGSCRSCVLFLMNSWYSIYMQCMGYIYSISMTCTTCRGRMGTVSSIIIEGPVWLVN